MKHKNHPPYGFGIGLIIVGVLLLMHTFDLWDFHWSQIMVLIGIFFLVSAFTGSDHGAVFPGSIVFLIGLFFLLRYYDILDDSMYYMWPIFLVIVGIAFYLLFIFKPNDWGLLIPGTILTGLGLLFFAYNYDVIDVSPGRLVKRYWPVILIFIGLKMLIDSGRDKRLEDKKNNQ